MYVAACAVPACVGERTEALKRAHEARRRNNNRERALCTESVRVCVCVLDGGKAHRFGELNVQRMSRGLTRGCVC